MISGPHRKFCEGVVAGLNSTAAYAAAYPSAQRNSARNRGCKLLRKSHIQAEVARLRGRSEDIFGSAVISHMERRTFLARIIRAEFSGGDESTGEKVSIRDRLMALKLDAEFAPPPAPEQDPERVAFHEMLRRIRTRPWRREDVIEQGRIAQEKAERGLTA